MQQYRAVHIDRHTPGLPCIPGAIVDAAAAAASDQHGPA